MRRRIYIALTLHYVRRTVVRSDQLAERKQSLKRVDRVEKRHSRKSNAKSKANTSKGTVPHYLVVSARNVICIARKRSKMNESLASQSSHAMLGVLRASVNIYLHK